MMNVISSEIYKIFKSKIFYGVSIILLMMNAMLLIPGLIATKSSTILGTGISAYQESYHADGIMFIILIFVVFLITSEYANGTIRQMGCRGIERWKLVLGQYVGISLVTIIVVLGFGFINLLTFTVLFGLGEVNIFVFMRMNLGMICIILATIGLGSFVSHLSKNVGIAVILSILLFLGSDYIAELFALLTKKDTLTIYGLRNMRRIIIDFNSSPEVIINICIVLLLIVMATIFGSYLLFLKRDID